MKMAKWFLVLFLPALISGCSKHQKVRKPVSWKKHKAHPTKKIDTLFVTSPMVRHYLDVGDLSGFQFAVSDNLIFRQNGDSIFFRMLQPGEANILFFDAGKKDTVIRVRVISKTNAFYESAVTRVEKVRTVIDSSPEHSLAYSIRRQTFVYKLLNQPFPGISLSGIDGKSFSAEILKGKFTLINLWYYNCGHCQEEMPGLNELKRIYSSNPEVQFLSFFADSAYKSGEEILFFEKNGRDGAEPVYSPIDFQFHHFFGAEKWADLLGVEGYPMTFLIDQQGIVRYIHDGGSEQTGEMLDQQLSLFSRQVTAR